MSKYNLEKLIKINVIPLKEDYFYTYREIKSKKHFWSHIQKAGIYDIVNRNYYSTFEEFNQQHENIYTIKNNILYILPRVELFFQGEYKRTSFFETEEEAKEYAKKIMEQTGKWI